MIKKNLGYLPQAVNNPHLTRDITTGPLVPSLPEGQRLVWDSRYGPFAKTALQRAIGKLQPELQQAIIAYYGEGLTYAAYGRRINRSRERVRALVAKARRNLRFHAQREMALLKRAIKVEIIPEGPLDPDWIGTEGAARLTGLTRDHIRYLTRSGKVKSRRPLWRPGLIMVNRRSLYEYVTAPAKRGQKKGVWKGATP